MSEGTKKRAGAQKGKPRRNPVPPWRRKPVLLGAAAVLAAASAGTGWWLTTSGAAGRAADAVRWRAIAAASDVGLRVDEILVVGRRQTTRDELMQALRLTRGAPILAFDPQDARARVEALDWIAEASVERLLPDTVLLTVKEREPLAIWQHEGRYALIDGQGTVIQREGLEPFADLVVVVGPDAHRHADALLRMIRTEPALMRHVEAAVRVAGRRWDIRLRGGIDVSLPEEDAEAAWRRLARFDARHHLLDRDVTAIDLRMGDRVVVRGANGIESPFGQET
jgi:cell division protein FtsQ